MCVAFPFLIKSIDGPRAIIESLGVISEADISLVDVQVGDYILVHAGFAIAKVEQDEAVETLEIFRAITGGEPA
jgi:hydrogenase expression/formation protein HypC